MNYEKWWELAERYLKEIVGCDADTEEKFNRYRDQELARCDEFFHSYDEFYAVCDIMGWSYHELMDWVIDNVDEINRLYKEVYSLSKGPYHNGLAVD